MFCWKTQGVNRMHEADTLQRPNQADLINGWPRGTNDSIVCHSNAYNWNLKQMFSYMEIVISCVYSGVKLMNFKALHWTLTELIWDDIIIITIHGLGLLSVVSTTYQTSCLGGRFHEIGNAHFDFKIYSVLYYIIMDYRISFILITVSVIFTILSMLHYIAWCFIQYAI